MPAQILCAKTAVIAIERLMEVSSAVVKQIIDEDYDLHFFDSLRPASASLALPFPIMAKAITVSLWVKFDQPQSKGSVLTMFNSKQANYSADLTEVLHLDSDGIKIAFFPKETALQLHFPVNQGINGGTWNHLLAYDGLLLRFSGYTEMNGKVERIPRSTCGREKRKRREESAVRVEVFTWGEYDVVYVAQDNASNTAECTFKIHVSREHCPQLEEPVNGVQACESWGPQLRYKACSIECREGYEFPRPPAVFYTCAADGMWRPRLRNQLIFRYPQCTNDVNGCVGARVDVGCSDEFARAKREMPSFKVRIELPVKRDPIQNAVSGQKSKVVDALQNEIINQGAFNLEKVLPNGRPDLTSFQLLDEFHCQSGQVTVNDVCASCEPGHFFDMSSLRCEPCGFGFFQPQGGSFECIACGVGKTTMTDKATNDEECRDECPDGEQLSSSGSCQPCPSGSYRTRGEHKQCVLCPPGKFPANLLWKHCQFCPRGTFQDEEQHTTCKMCPTDHTTAAQDGEQLSSSGSCQSCPSGSYRTRGTTTESVGAIRREQCNTPLCKAGQFLVKETKHCQFCPRGTFQDEEQHTTCKMCPTDHTTAAQGATAESQCYSTNQCATGEDNCSWHAHCIDLPDDNDVPSFQCKCKPGYRGNGTYCQGGVVAVLVVIVIVIFMISFRFNRSQVDFADKVQIDDLQQSNFLYGRPAIEAPRPIGFYYEDDEEYESKTMYVTRDEESKEAEQRRRIAQQHMYRPGQTE
ncbi:GCC2 and GCC3 [Teladorsagia circumcincta]|uniref:GCC2 and GCC3 n=2 Tax=Teladorsagia circumcincta TaxID=45464 RepID=A0A2G9UAY1_TELCI|nr:GCC2 and GCC3 [Teladorsagia circumcincta]